MDEFLEWLRRRGVEEEFVESYRQFAERLLHAAKGKEITTDLVNAALETAAATGWSTQDRRNLARTGRAWLAWRASGETNLGDEPATAPRAPRPAAATADAPASTGNVLAPELEPDGNFVDQARREAAQYPDIASIYIARDASSDPPHVMWVGFTNDDPRVVQFVVSELAVRLPPWFAEGFKYSVRALEDRQLERDLKAQAYKIVAPTEFRIRTDETAEGLLLKKYSISIEVEVFPRKIEQALHGAEERLREWLALRGDNAENARITLRAHFGEIEDVGAELRKLLMRGGRWAIDFGGGQVGLEVDLRDYEGNQFEF